MDVIGFIYMFLTVVTWVIIGDAILSWFMPADRFPRSLTTKVTEPLYRPIHKLIDPRKTGGFDLAPLIVLVAIQLVQRALL